MTTIMLPSYPDYLPLPLKLVRSNKTGETIIRTDRLKGLARNRRWTTSPSVLFDAEWIIENEKAELFIAWHSSVIADGAEWFSMPSYYAGQLDDRRTRFTGMYSGPDPISSTHIKITAELEIFERPMIDPDWLIIPDYWYNKDIFDIAMNDKWPLNPWQVYILQTDQAINEEWPLP